MTTIPPPEDDADVGVSSDSQVGLLCAEYETAVEQLKDPNTNTRSEIEALRKAALRSLVGDDPPPPPVDIKPLWQVVEAARAEHQQVTRANKDRNVWCSCGSTRDGCATLLALRALDEAGIG